MLDDATTAHRCTATKRDGQPCQGQARPSGYCFAHDPELAATRREARRKGGQARHGRRITWADDDQAAQISIRSVEDIMALLSRAVMGEMQLENSHNRNRTLGTLAMAALKALEVGEFEQRLERLEAQINDER